MDQVPTVEARREDPPIKVSKADLLAAWSILENLAISLDQIGGTFAESGEGPVGGQARHAYLEALDDYLSPRLVDSINQARVRLGSYIQDEEAEALSDEIDYWDYAGVRR